VLCTVVIAEKQSFAFRGCYQSVYIEVKNAAISCGNVVAVIGKISWWNNNVGLVIVR